MLFVFSLLSCNSDNRTTTDKKKKEPSPLDVTTNLLKAINNLNKASEEAKNIDSSTEKRKDFNKIQPIYFDSNEDTSGLKVIIADGR